MNISNNIKKYRNLAKLTQKDLASKVGCAEITIRQYENGKREPRFEMLCKIAEALSIPVGYLIESISLGIMTENDVKAMEYFKNHPEESINNNDNGQEYLLESYEKLNSFGKTEARKRVNELTEIPRYTEPED